jgi:hypothetical protein
MGLNIPSVWEDYRGAVFRSWTKIINDKDAQGATARASFDKAAAKFQR